MRNWLNRNLDWLLLGMAWLTLMKVKILLAYALVFVVFVAVMFLLKKSIKTALFYGLLLTIPFERGFRGYDIQVVAPGPEIWIKGFKLYFGMTPKLIASVSLFLLMLNQSWDVKKRALLVNWLVVVFLGWGLLNSFQADAPQLALWGWWRLLITGWLMVISQYFFKLRQHREFFFKYLVSGLIFFGLIGTWQFISQQPMGIFLEDISVRFPFGRFTNESRLVYRVSGLVSHPTYFGSLLSLFLPFSLAGLLFSKKNKLVLFVASLLGLIAVFATFSRSAWLALMMIFFVFLWWGWKKKKKVHQFLSVKILALSLISFLVIFSGLLQVRLSTFNDIWTVGSGKGRVILLKEASKMIQNNPVWGVGLNNFTKVMRNSSNDPNALSLLYPVHNTFILFIAELGWFGGLMFVVLIGVGIWLS